jgi:hypothetical protein
MTNATPKLLLKDRRLMALLCNEGVIMHPLVRDEFVARFHAIERARKKKSEEAAQASKAAASPD